MFKFLLLLVGITLAEVEIESYPYLMPCDPQKWQAGKPYSFCTRDNRCMSPRGFSTNGQDCMIEFDTSANDPNNLASGNGTLGIYAPNQVFAVKFNKTLKPSVILGVFDASGYPTCKVSHVEENNRFYIIAPAYAGQITIRGLCGTSSKIEVSNELILTSITGLPEFVPGAGPIQKSLDPDYDYQKSLDAQAQLFFKARDKEDLVFIKLVRRNGLGFLSFALGKSMKDSIALIAYVDKSNGSPSVNLFKLSDNVVPTNIIAKDSKQLESFGITQVRYSLLGNDSSMSFTWSRKIVTDARFSLLSKEMDIMWAYGTLNFELGHSPTTRGIVSNISFSESKEFYNVPFALELHIVMMSMSFLIFFPFGGLLPLYNNMKTPSQRGCNLPGALWFKSHFYIQLLSLFLSFVGFFASFAFVKHEYGGSHFIGFHRGFGFFLILLILFQVVQGMKRPGKENPPSSSRIRFEILHKVFAYVIIFGGFINSFIGIRQLESLTGGEGEFFILNGSSAAVYRSGFGGGLGIFVIISVLIFTLVILAGFTIRYRTMNKQTVDYQTGIML